MDDFADQLIAAISEIEGADHYTMDLNDRSTINTPDFLNYLKQENTFALLLNNIGLPFFDRGAQLGRKYDIPVYNFLVDHPRNFPRFLMEPECDLRLFLLDRDHIDFVKTFYNNINITHFLPDGGFDPGNGQAQWKARGIDVLYTGSCNRERNYFGIPFFSDGGQDYYNYVIQYILQHPDSTVDAAVRTYYAYRGIEPDMEQRFILEGDAAAFIEENIRRYYKLEGMHALDNAGITVEVFGDNWEDEKRPFSDRIHIHSRIAPVECNRLPSDTRISLNFMPWYRRGCSERVFNNMLGGSLCVTDSNEYLRGRFEDRKELVYYELNDMQKMADTVKYYLEHAKEAEEIAFRGMVAARSADTWSHRMKTIVEYIRQDMSQDFQEDQNE